MPSTDKLQGHYVEAAVPYESRDFVPHHDFPCDIVWFQHLGVTSTSPIYFAEHCHYDNEEIAANVNCGSCWLLRELEGIRVGWQGISHLTGGFSTVLAVDKRNLDGS